MFLTEKSFPSCLWATYLVFILFYFILNFFFINSTLNLCQGVIFWRLSGERRQARSERGALPPSLVFLSTTTTTTTTTTTNNNNNNNDNNNNNNNVLLINNVSIKLFSNENLIQN